MFHYQTFYSVQLAFVVLESIFVGGGFKKKSHILQFLKNGVFAKQILAQCSYKQCFHSTCTLKVVNNFQNQNSLLVKRQNDNTSPGLGHTK